MATIDTPVRERIDAETQEARNALWDVLLSADTPGRHRAVFVQDAETGQLVGHAEPVDHASWPEVRWNRYRRVRAAIRRLAEDAVWRDNELARELLDQTLELEERMEQDPDG